MDRLIPWERLVEQIRPSYPKAGKGRVPYLLESILRVHCVQLFYNLSDPATDQLAPQRGGPFRLHAGRVPPR